MLKIRLRPNGRSPQTSYRVVVVEERDKRNGAIIDDLGFWKRDVKPHVVQIDKKAVSMWETRGAQTTDAVKKLLTK